MSDNYKENQKRECRVINQTKPASNMSILKTNPNTRYYLNPKYKSLNCNRIQTASTYKIKWVRKENKWKPTYNFSSNSAAFSDNKASYLISSTNTSMT